MRHTHRSGYGNNTKIFVARWVRWSTVFVDLKLPLLIAGPINLCIYFPVACVISQKFYFIFFNIHTCLLELCGFLLRLSHTHVSMLLIHFKHSWGLHFQVSVAAWNMFSSVSISLCNAKISKIVATLIAASKPQLFYTSYIHLSIITSQKYILCFS